MLDTQVQRGILRLDLPPLIINKIKLFRLGLRNLSALFDSDMDNAVGFGTTWVCRLENAHPIKPVVGDYQ